ncbi:hypothetical protein J2Z42_000928 [Clostridium algifaecis]|uniref:Uncharacterized protein n=1 Tax=Clostridium algifaecis TaxID=1472040 RepID=A0ABS4KQE8_9CLOT|nr:hypothetical protein [Clostridium algifaecis]MBP2032263.1 hypothetical protein [Clostridium algifaecis]
MKRINKIYNYLSEQTQGLKIEDLTEKVGFSTIQISNELGILK